MAAHGLARKVTGLSPLGQSMGHRASDSEPVHAESPQHACKQKDASDNDNGGVNTGSVR